MPIDDLRKKLSNSEMFINEAIDIARNIKYYCDSSDLETKLKLQKTVFPKGLWINPSHRGCLTRYVNYFSEESQYLQGFWRGVKQKKSPFLMTFLF